MTRLVFSSLLVASMLLNAGCDPKPAPTNPTPAPAPSKPEGGSPQAPKSGHGGAIIELGTATIKDLTIRASRDQGEIKAGGDAPIDVWITTSDGKPASVAAVRFWIGTADAKGSIKAKADIENPKEPDHWHTHAEVPAPMPPDAKLWIEVEIERDAKSATSFDLKQ